jgi:hypothetical protein
MKIGSNQDKKEDILFTLEEKPCIDCKYYFNETTSTCVFSENPPAGKQVYSSMDNCLCDQWDGIVTSGEFFEACCRTNGPELDPECPGNSSSSE